MSRQTVFFALTLTLVALRVSPARATDYVVSSASDPVAACQTNGAVTLREAITAANTNTACGDAIAGQASDTIRFSLGNASLIHLGTVLPQITARVAIDGQGVVTIMGPEVPGETNGLVLRDHEGSSIRGLSLVLFRGAAIVLDCIESPGPCGTHTITANRIGIDTQGAVFPNGWGIRVMNAGNNRIGLGPEGDRNIISGNNAGGIHMFGTGASDNVLRGNYIGVSPNGGWFAGVGNGSEQGIFGIQLSDGASRNIIGGTRGMHGNVIAGHTGGQIMIEAVSVDTVANEILGNNLGVDASGSSVPLRGGTGPIHANIFIESVLGSDRGTRIGGPNGRGNVISGHEIAGITLRDAVQPIIQGNYIGTDASGLVALPNVAGIVASGTDITIGGLNEGEGNVISGNVQRGIEMVAGEGSKIEGNIVGLASNGESALPNGTGIYVARAKSVSIGSLAIGSQNIISANRQAGVEISAMAWPVLVARNLIGETRTGTARGNLVGVSVLGVREGQHRLFFNRVVHNTSNGVDVNGPATAWMNKGEIVSNGGVGVRVLGNAAVRMTGVLTYANGGLGVDVGNVGVNPNDTRDGDTGPNALQNHPVISEAVIDDTGSRIVGTLNSVPGGAYRIELFAVGDVPDGTGHGEAREFLGLATLSCDENGDASFSQTTSRPLLPGERVTATAQDEALPTSSEHGPNHVVVDRRAIVDAGVMMDASVMMDAGALDAGISEDAGAMDASTVEDGGVASDSSVGEDAGPTEEGGVTTEDASTAGDASLGAAHGSGCQCLVGTGSTDGAHVGFALLVCMLAAMRRRSRSSRRER